MCHADDQWTETLPLVLLGIRSAYKEDLNASTAELVYGETLRIPGEYLEQSSQKDDIQPFLQRLRRRMNDLRPTPATRHANQAVFVHKDLKDSTRVFTSRRYASSFAAAIQRPL